MTNNQFKLATLITHGQIRAANQPDFMSFTRAKPAKPFVYKPEFKHLNFINKVRYVVARICRMPQFVTLVSTGRKSAC